MSKTSCCRIRTNKISHYRPRSQHDGTNQAQTTYVVEDGKPTAVILDIKQYEQMLERLEDVDDLAALRDMRKRPLRFRSLTKFLEEYKPSVL